MGQKVSPIGMRVGVIRDWESRWYADKDYADLLLEDVKIREFVAKECKAASVSRVEIERSKNRVEIMIRTARPGVIIGTSGENIENLKKKLEKLTKKNVYIKVLEIANPDLDARLVARSIADQLEQRASFRTCQKKAIQRTMRAGAKGI
ncbi:MAG: 30S ribosomal protein S3, partial [Erysipelotrichaceae bacterium]|nr:30S ribosomal protein S3 [Erysipelotrichaceae bacterium]